MVRRVKADEAEIVNRRIGIAIRERRLAVGLTQADLGEAIGITYQQIQKYESGENRTSVAALIGLAKALGTTAAEIVAAVEKG